MGIPETTRLIAHEHGTTNPFEICKSLGIWVLFHPLTGVRGYHKEEQGSYFIVISIHLPSNVAEFVCAHELGHFILHKRINRVFLDACTFSVSGRYEDEADKFAAHLLWGEEPLYQDALSEWEMSEMLNISKSNVNARLIALGIYH